MHHATTMRRLTSATALCAIVTACDSAPYDPVAQSDSARVEEIVMAEETVVLESYSIEASGYTQPEPLMLPAPAAIGDRYEEVVPNPVVAVAEQPVSTFSIDVDTASYANVRRFLEDGMLPPAEAVRIEELVNYFDYAYAPPADPLTPFATTVTLMPTPWNAETRLVHIGIKGYDLVEAERPRANLVFLVDVSGSMSSPDKLELLVKGLKLLVDALEPDDRVAIVTYAGSVGVVLPPTAGSDKATIRAALDRLGAGGSTAGAAGLALAYEVAREAFIGDGVNRVILATDGDFNVGVNDPDALQAMIARERDSGVYLSVLGFGRGNLNDALMQRIAQHGNGNAAYIDSLLEAKKVLVDQMGGTLFPIANDVKIQVEFNPAQVAEYRLLGYETRLLAREDFDDDRVDAGEIGNGHAVTAIYEIVPAASGFRWVAPLRYGESAEAPDLALADELGFLRIRYKLPGEATSHLIETPMRAADTLPSLAAAGTEVRFAVAVAGYGQLLRDESRIGGWGWDDTIALARASRGDDAAGYRAEFLRLVELASALDRR